MYVKYVALLDELAADSALSNSLAADIGGEPAATAELSNCATREDTLAPASDLETEDAALDTTDLSTRPSASIASSVCRSFHARMSSDASKGSPPKVFSTVSRASPTRPP